jgi:N-acetylmuramoyl-L-alanine amidase
MRVALAAALLLPALVLAPAATPAAAQQDEQAVSEARVRERGTGWLVTAAGRLPLPFAVTFQGPLVDLGTVTELLGGELEIGPLEQSHTLRLAEREIVLGPDSAVMIMDQEIIQLRDTPRVGATGLQVPLDALARTYGDLLGFDFRWNAESRELGVARRPLRMLTVQVDDVHFQGVSTLVLKFGAQPRYRVAAAGSRLEVEVLGDRLEAEEDVVVLRDDPLIRQVEIGDSRIRIDLAPEAVAAEPYVVHRPPWYQLVFDVSRQSLSTETVPRAERRRPSAGSELKIMIDPGHGGDEIGAIGKSGSEEKDLTLVLARTLKRQLESRLPVRVVLTRSDDQELPLETRTALANQNQADLFVSLHLNSEVGTGARGAETFFLSMEASDAAAAQAAERENRAGAAPPAEIDDELGLQLILWDLAQSHHLAESQRLATLIQQELNEALGIRNRGVKQAPFRVLMGATMPAVLVELGFLSNPQEEAKLQTASYRSELVSALVRAIIRYRAQLLDGGAQGVREAASVSQAAPTAPAAPP